MIKIFPKIKKRGFTIVEMMVDLALILGVLSVVSSFIWSFYRNSNSGLLKEELRTGVINSLTILQREILGASEILYRYGNYTTDENTLILAIPAHNQSGRLLYDQTTMTPLHDIVIIYKDNDGKDLTRKNEGNSLKNARLKIKSFPVSGSNRKPLNGLIIFSDLSPHDPNSGKYLAVTEKYNPGSGFFSFYRANRTKFESIDSTAVKNTAFIRTTFLAEKEYGMNNIQELLEFETRLRNLQRINQ